MKHLPGWKVRPVTCGNGLLSEIREETGERSRKILPTDTRWTTF